MAARTTTGSQVTLRGRMERVALSVALLMLLHALRDLLALDTSRLVLFLDGVVFAALVLAPFAPPGATGRRVALLPAGGLIHIAALEAALALAGAQRAHWLLYMTAGVVGALLCVAALVWVAGRAMRRRVWLYALLAGAVGSLAFNLPVDSLARLAAAPPAGAVSALGEFVQQFVSYFCWQFAVCLALHFNRMPQ